ncbi:hypothetical protein B0H34DRAFT_798013 [Crassisporium funariophilum]|nr:hypothetical protein B0H34DRAFT_798013 [Crassisporium funariophilum]
MYRPPPSPPLKLSEIQHATQSTLTALSAHLLNGCLMGSAAGVVYGMAHRVPRDVDILISYPLPSHTADGIKRLIVSADARFFVLPSRVPGATHCVLWFDLLAPGGTESIVHPLPAVGWDWNEANLVGWDEGDPTPMPTQLTDKDKDRERRSQKGKSERGRGSERGRESGRARERARGGLGGDARGERLNSFAPPDLASLPPAGPSLHPARGSLPPLPARARAPTPPPPPPPQTHSDRICKIDIILPGTFSIPAIPSIHLHPSPMLFPSFIPLPFSIAAWGPPQPPTRTPTPIPCIPYPTLLLLKLRAWAEHTRSDAPDHLSARVPDEEGDVEELLRVGVGLGRGGVVFGMEPTVGVGWHEGWGDGGWRMGGCGSWEEARRCVRRYVRKWPRSAGGWRDVGFV